MVFFSIRYDIDTVFWPLNDFFFRNFWDFLGIYRIFGEFSENFRELLANFGNFRQIFGNFQQIFGIFGEKKEEKNHNSSVSTILNIGGSILDTLKSFEISGFDRYLIR